MKKNGILTYQRAPNHGALLQAFATQSLIKQLGQTSELIDYRNIGTPEFYKEQQKTKPGLKSLISRYIRNLFFADIIMKQNDLFKSFQNKHLIYSKKKYLTRDDLIRSNVENDYTKIITGSDQVWNTDISINDTSYFLDFVSKSNKKVAFAASFGKTSIDKSISIYVFDEIKKIKYLSVREKEGSELIKYRTGKEAYVCLDPTLILSNKFWNKYLVKPNLDYKYILCFVIGNFSDLTSQACKVISKRMKLPIIMVNNHGILNRYYKNYKTIDRLSPFDLLGLIKNSEVLLTTSFHGTAFAINFNKEFYSLPTSLKNKANERNSRITSILDTLDISNRYVNDINDLEKKIKIQKKIDYKKVNNLLKIEREHSFQFLKSALDD